MQDDATRVLRCETLIECLSFRGHLMQLLSFCFFGSVIATLIKFY